MSPYLFNIRVNVYQTNESTDEYGAAIATGTLLYSYESARMDQYSVQANQIAKQGMETNRSYNFYMRSTWQQPRNVQENDVIEIIFPPHHFLYLARFRVNSVNYESFHPSDRHGLLELGTERIVKSRSNNSN